MAEASQKSELRWWAKAGGVLGLVVAVVVGVWGLLPDIAAWGLRLGATRGASAEVLKWLGPRAVGQVLQNTYYLPGKGTHRHVRRLYQQAELDPAARRAFVSSLRRTPDGSLGVDVLHDACSLGYGRLVSALLDSGVDVGARNDVPLSPLHTAASCDQRDIARLLLQRGAEVNAGAYKGMTPLHTATNWGRSEFARLLVQSGAEVNATDEDGVTPLHCAANEGVYDLVEFFLDNGADVNAKCDYTDYYYAGCVGLRKATTALHIALEGPLMPEEYKEIILHLLRRGAEVNAVDEFGWSALHLAARFRVDEDILRELVARGADVDALNDGDQTALDVAIEFECEDAAAFLRRHGAKTAKELEEGKAAEVKDE